MAAYAALVSLLNNIHAITSHPHLSTSLDNSNIQPLLEKTNFLLDFIESNDYGRGSKEVQDLERKIAAAAHAAEDLIESHILNQIHLGKSAASLACALDLRQIIHDMDAVMEKVIQIKEKGEVMEEKSTHLAAAGPPMQSGEFGMVGLEHELNHLLKELNGDESSRRIISIVGMPGLGKTTLAKNVYENSLIKEQYQFRAWATMSQQFNAQEVLSKLLSSLGEFNNGTIDDLGLWLHKTLSGRRYLIVLDDIWSVRDWDEVKHFFPDSNNGSRILLTTRLSNVAKDLGSSLLEMRLLDEDNSWTLLCAKAFPDQYCPTKLEMASKDIAKSCYGLPLSVVVIGGLLQKSPMILTYWYDIKHLNSILNEEKAEKFIFNTLSLSYYYLPPHLKPCFLYMGVFKDHSQIQVSSIIKLWVAKGFIKPIGSQALEEIAAGYINDLIDRNLIIVDEYGINGKAISCHIHDIVIDLSIKLAENEEFLHWNKGKIQGTVVADGYMGSMEVKVQLASSIIKEECTMQPIKHRLLRVVNEGDFGSKRYYCENVNLRYLCVHPWDTSVHSQELRTLLSFMWNMQILSSFGPLIAPIEIWKVRQLRQVQYFHIYLPCPPPRNEEDELLILEKLHTLKTVVNFKLCKEVCKIIPNIKKLYLCYDIQLHEYDDSLIECLCNVNHLQKLESLNIRWRVSGGKLDEKLITSFPKSVQKLSLSGCELRWDDMSIIGSLPQLQILKLEDIHVPGEGQWSPIDGQFRRLRFLLLKHCKNLVSWDANASHFPVLQKLLLDGLWGLKEIPSGIGDILTLKLIKVEFCSISVAISAIRINEDQLNNDGQLQVLVTVAKWHMDRFNQKLAAEGLTMNNIHFKTFSDE